MTRFLPVIALLVLAVCCVQAQKKVVCYYGTWSTYRNGNGRCDVEHLDPWLCTHLIYTFVGLGDDYASIKILDAWLDLPSGRDNMRKFNDLKKINTNLKTIVAIGGWNEGSYKYSIMANNAALRAKFVQNALDFTRRYGFDGMDLDWEYPNKRDSANGVADIQAFTLLVKEMKEQFSKYGLLVTAAVSAAEKPTSTSYNIPEISKHLDFINVMTYDLHGAWDSTVGHNAGLHKSLGQTDDYTVTQAVEYWLSQGAPPEKLIMGVPMYGRTFMLSDTSQTQVGARASGPGIAGQYTYQNGMIGFNEWCEKQLTETHWTSRWDSSALVPYAVSGRNWVSYDDDRSITEKVKYALSQKLGGIMIWSIETDDFRGVCYSEKFKLLNTINRALRGQNGAVVETPDETENPDASVENPGGETGESVPSNPGESVDNQKPEGAPSVVCTSEGFIKDPMDCSIFYYCVRYNIGQTWKPVLFKCPANLGWDSSINACNHRTAIGC